jgi:hypothetical protein
MGQHWRGTNLCRRRRRRRHRHLTQLTPTLTFLRRRHAPKVSNFYREDRSSMDEISRALGRNQLRSSFNSMPPRPSPAPGAGARPAYERGGVAGVYVYWGGHAAPATFDMARFTAPRVDASAAPAVLSGARHAGSSPAAGRRAGATSWRAGGPLLPVGRLPAQTPPPPAPCHSPFEAAVPQPTAAFDAPGAGRSLPRPHGAAGRTPVHPAPCNHVHAGPPFERPPLHRTRTAATAKLIEQDAAYRRRMALLETLPATVMNELRSAARAAAPPPPGASSALLVSRAGVGVEGGCPSGRRGRQAYRCSRLLRR